MFGQHFSLDAKPVTQPLGVKNGTVSAAPGNALRAAQVQVDGVGMCLHQARRSQQGLRVIGTELYEQRPARMEQIRCCTSLLSQIY